MNRSERTHQSIDTFILDIKKAQIEEIVVRITNEFRPIQSVPITSDFKYKRIELLGYRDSILYKCTLEGQSPESITPSLASSGLRIRWASGNIT